MSEAITISDAIIFAPAASVPEGIQNGDALTVTVGETIFTGTYGGTAIGTYKDKTTVWIGFDNRPSISTADTIVGMKGGTVADNWQSTISGGGGQVSKGGAFYADNVLFYGNTAGEPGTKKNGGGLNIANDSYVNIYGSTFSSNTASRAGAIMFNAGTLDISNSFFFDNSGESYGSVISTASTAGTITIKNSWFGSNKNGSSNMGGAIYFTGASGTKSTISGSTFTENTSALSGAAIVVNSTGYELSVSGSTFHKNKTTGNGGAFYVAIAESNSNISDTLFLENETLGGNSNSIGGAIYFGKKDVASLMSVTGSTFTGNKSYYGGAVVVTEGTLNITDTDFNSNDVGAEKTSYGGAIYITKGSVNISDADFNENTAYRGGAVYIVGGTLNICDTNFTNNSVSGTSDNTSSGGAALYANGGTINISNTTFAGNKTNGSNANGAAIYGGSSDITIGDGTVFDGNNADNVGGALALFKGSVTITGEVKFLTSTDDIYVSASNVPNVSLTFDKAVVTLNANISSKIAIEVIDTEFIFNNSANIKITGDLDFTDQKSKMTFANKRVDFYSDGEDLSGVFITVTGDRKNGNVVAGNITAIGTVKVDNAFQYAELSGTDLVVKDVAAAISSGDVQTSYTGNGLTVMDGGAVGTLFATKGDESEIATKISGGKVEQNLVGGAYVAAGNTAEVDKVELLIDGTAEVAAKVYAGGYLYGNAGDAEAAAEAQMTVDLVNITLDGGAVSTNMYGGAHARQNGNAKVDTVNITVTDGSHGRIYAGGWAEKGAVSSVGTSTVIISGGTVDYLYGAGANADGKTYVDTTNITVSDAAVVNTIFMGGRYGYSWVDYVNLTFAGENKELTRLSGVSSAGMDYAKATVVELETNVTADLIDYVDKFVINEGCMLTAKDEFYLGDRNNETGATEDFTTFDFIAEGEANWTAVAGIDDFTNAKFAVNGSEAQLWNGTAAIEIGGYELTYDAKDKTIKLAQITA